MLGKSFYCKRLRRGLEYCYEKESLRYLLYPIRFQVTVFSGSVKEYNIVKKYNYNINIINRNTMFKNIFKKSIYGMLFFFMIYGGSVYSQSNQDSKTYIKLARLIDKNAVSKFRNAFTKADFDPNYIPVKKYKKCLFSLAAIKGNIEIARFLLTKGAAINTIDRYTTAMHKCLKGKHYKFGFFLLENGFDPSLEEKNKRNKLPLNVISARSLCENNEGMELFEALLLKGMNPNLSARDGATALLLAVYYDKPEIIEMLYSNGADMNYGVHPLKISPTSIKDDVVENNFTPLMVAVFYNKERIVKQLLCYENVDKMLRGTLNNMTAFELAQEADNFLIAGLLK